MKPGCSQLGSTPPLYPVLFSYLLGIVLASHLVLPRPLILAIMAALVCSVFFSLARPKKGTSGLIWAVSFFCLGILALHLHLRQPSVHKHISHFTGRGRVVVEGTLAQPPEKTAKRTRLYVKTESITQDERSIRTTGKVLLSSPHRHETLNYGDRIRFATSLRCPSNFNNPGGFDYRRYLAARQIWTTAFVNDPRQIVRVAPRQGSALRTCLEMLRNRIRAFLSQHSTSTACPILKALILGERGTIPDAVREDFAISGAAHILAISGLHLGIIAFFVFRGFLWTFKRSERIALTTNVFKLAALLTIPPIILYTLLAGARVTTVRATIMIIVYLLSLLLDRPRNLYHTLALAALIVTLIDPACVLESSFQLSFMAVLAILFLFPRLTALFRREEILLPRQKGGIQWVATRSRDLFVVSLAAIIGTCPIIAYHFHRFSPMGLISNFVVIPILGFFAIPSALISTLLSFCSADLAIPFLRIASWGVDLSASIIRCLARIPGASFHVATPTILEILLFYAFFAVIFHLRRSSVYRMALILIVCVGAVDSCYWLVRTHFHRDLRITAVDVGQGDCALVEFPRGRRALIDGGGFYDNSFDIGKNVVAPFLWKNKIQKVDYLVLTHPDPDHLNGLNFIARNFRVEELWDSGQKSDSPAFQELMNIVEQKGIRRVSLFRGEEPRIVNGVVVQPLHPPRKDCSATGVSPGCTRNNLSLVLRFVFGDQTVLFTGDIEKEAEAELIASEVSLDSHVIKVPHHGSRTSSTPKFLAKVQPEIAIISVRQRSYRSLPNTKVLKRYERLGCKIFRTDLHGAVTLKTDGKTLRIKTFRKPPPPRESFEARLNSFREVDHLAYRPW